MNPLAIFTSMKPVAKGFFFVCLAAVIITFMVLAYKSGTFNLIVESLFDAIDGGKE